MRSEVCLLRWCLRVLCWFLVVAVLASFFDALGLHAYERKSYKIVTQVTATEDGALNIESFIRKLKPILKQNKSKEKIVITLRNVGNFTISDADYLQLKSLALKNKIKHLIINTENSKLEAPKSWDLALGSFKLCFAATFKYFKYYSKMDPTAISFYILTVKELAYEIFFSMYSQTYLNAISKLKKRTNKAVVYGVNYTRKVLMSVLDRSLIMWNAPWIYAEDPYLFSVKFLWSLLTSEALNSVIGTTADVATILAVEKGYTTKNKARYFSISLDFLGIIEKAMLISAQYEVFWATFTVKSLIKLGFYVKMVKYKPKNVFIDLVGLTRRNECEALIEKIKRRLN